MTESTIFPCKRFDKNGKLIEVISKEKLREKHWENYNNKDFKQASMRAAITLDGSRPAGQRSEPDYTYVNKDYE